MKRMLTVIVMLPLGSVLALGAERTWTGKISDSICMTAHKPALEHGGEKLSNHDCTVSCVRKGAKYVFVSHGKVYKIENQDLAGLKEHAGQTVTLTGEMLGNNIKVAGVAAGSTARNR